MFSVSLFLFLEYLNVYQLIYSYENVASGKVNN